MYSSFSLPSPTREADRESDVDEEDRPPKHQPCYGVSCPFLAITLVLCHLLVTTHSSLLAIIPLFPLPTTAGSLVVMLWAVLKARTIVGK